MFAIQLTRNVLQSVACMLLSVVIVSGSLAVGAIGAESLERQAIAAMAERA